MVDWSRNLTPGRGKADAPPAVDAASSPAGFAAAADAGSGAASSASVAARSGRSDRGKAAFPSKTSINLVNQMGQRTSMLTQVALFAVVLVLVGVFAKFAVADPLASGMESSSEVAAAQARLDDLMAANESYAATNDKYARYVVPGLTEEELALADRNALLDLIQQNLMSVGYLSSVKVVGNTISATSLGADLAQVSSLVERLEADSRVAHVTVSTAQGKDNAGTSATVEVALKGALDEAAGSGAEAGAPAEGAAAGKEAGNGAA